MGGITRRTLRPRFWQHGDLPAFCSCETKASFFTLDSFGKLRLPYSTVTDFAKFRGWSTSVPLMTAVW